MSSNAFVISVARKSPAPYLYAATTFQDTGIDVQTDDSYAYYTWKAILCFTRVSCPYLSESRTVGGR